MSPILTIIILIISAICIARYYQNKSDITDVKVKVQVKTPEPIKVQEIIPTKSYLIVKSIIVISLITASMIWLMFFHNSYL